MRVLLVAMVVTAGCTHHAAPPEQVDAPPGSIELACESQATTFPPLQKECVEVTDCDIALHMIDCCGTLVAIGLNAVSGDAFNSAEEACEQGYPGCGCASRPTMAEDGRTQVDGTIAVRCESQQCRTYVP